MKIKNSILLIFALLTIFGLSAQSDDSDIDCTRELSFFDQTARIKDYEAALSHYENLVNHCPPDLNAAVYQHGNRMFNHFIKESKTQAEKKKNVLAYIDNYSKLKKHFPNKTSGNFETRKAQLKLDNDIGTLEEQYQAFDEAWKKDAEAFTDPKALYSYFSLLIDLQDEGKRSLEDSFRKYDEVMGKIQKEEAKRAEEAQVLREKKENGEALSKNEKKKLNNAETYLSNYMKIKESIDVKIGTRADCDNLIPLYTKNFEENKTDAEWLKLAAHRLSEKQCTEGDLFYNITEALHELEPSAKSAKYLGQLAGHKGETTKALDYYKQSAELESDKLDKARIYFLIANNYKKKSRLSQARNYYRKALQNNPALGKAHLQIASMYAQSVNNCGETDFEKRAVYWVAAQEAEAAGRVDPSVKTTANQTAEAYRGRAPQAKDIFNEEMAGKTLQIKCWINKSVKVPNL